MPIVNCKVCNRETYKANYYIKKFNGNIYCSMDCFHNKQKTVFKQVTNTCLQCGKVFKVHPSDIKLGRAKLCSFVCKKKWMVGDNHGKTKPKVERVCVQCGNIFLIDGWRLKDAGRGQLCSRSCTHKYQVGEKNPSWGGWVNVDEVGARTHRGISRWRKQVLRRDNYTCIGCGSKDNLEVDHIKPFAKYPELRIDVNNGRTLCHDCHLKTNTYGRQIHMQE